MSGAGELSVRVWRGGAEGRFETFRVPARDNQTVLDVVTYIQRHLDAGLAYRFACRVGVCGSCAMTVNGRPRWTCRTHVSRVAKGGALTLAPLQNLPVIRDLVTDMTVFFEKWQAARGRFVPGAEEADRLAAVAPESAEREAASAAIECINCGVCYSACDVVAWREDYLGPAALNRAWAAYNDVRDGDRTGVLKAVSVSAGCHNCHTHQSCAEHCPVALNPTFSIAGLKRASLKAKLKGELS
ncbi:MAG: succinate dehydrogenase/fumarate reductase iron-sulfur subunit [Alphaproteobacteria bacterium]|nr:MAG: succinate dehydrogenase/fumarate reductase iron-sulfur subunit [Alphaproteobacteria bacterium]